MVNVVLLCTIAVPAMFITLTLCGIWAVPHDYSLLMLGVSIAIFVIDRLLIHSGKFEIFTTYFGLMGASFFIMLMGSRNVIILSISYGIVPFISCLYYNRRLTSIITVANYLFVVITFIFRAFDSHNYDVFYGYTQSTLEWFISHISGVTIEFFFVYLISHYITRRTHSTLQDLLHAQEDRQNAYNQLLEQNISISQLNANFESKNEELHDAQFKIIQFVSQVLGSHDLFTGRHVMHTKKYVEMICLQLRKNGHYQETLTDENIRLFSSAAFLHDIGKIHIPEAILNKIGRFTPEEFDLMKSHPEEGKKLLQFLPPIENGLFNKIAIEMAYCHHEKWDGTGYPQKISETQIPLCARIMTAADVMDALISQRLYKEPMSIDQAIKVFEDSKGTHFEPCIAEAVIDLRDQIEAEDKLFKEQENSSNAAELEWWQRYHANLKND